jgi:SAM-dependent methyltransferase
MTGRSAVPSGYQGPAGYPGGGDRTTTVDLDPVAALFDDKAAAWPAKYAQDGRLAGRLSQFTEAVTAWVTVGGEVLDLGCGSGELARRLAAAGYRVTGCDIAPRMLLQATAADPGRAVRWLPLEPGWQALPFEAGRLDAVIAASVLEYADDPPAILRECARVLRPGGTVICTVPDVTHPVRWLEWPLVVVARVISARAAARVWPRLGNYMVYLRVSRHRRSARWWRTAAGRAGLEVMPDTVGGKHAPLRMLIFTRPAKAPGLSGRRVVQR